MNRLTSQEKTVLIVVFSLLLIGLAVKTYRTANPAMELQRAAEAAVPRGEQVKN